MLVEAGYNFMETIFKNKLSKVASLSIYFICLMKRIIK